MVVVRIRSRCSSERGQSRMIREPDFSRFVYTGGKPKPNASSCSSAAVRNPTTPSPPNASSCSSAAVRNPATPSPPNASSCSSAAVRNPTTPSPPPPPPPFHQNPNWSSSSPPIIVERRKKKKKPIRVILDGQEKVLSPYFPLPPNAIVIDYHMEEEEEADVMVTSNKNKRKKTEKAQDKNKKIKPRSVLTAKEKRKDAYRRVTAHNTWKPPASPYGLLQERHFFDPWRVLIICMLLNQTSGKQVTRIVERLFNLCPNAEAAAKVREEDLQKLLKPLGLWRMRTERIKKFSCEYLGSEWTHVTQLHGVGKYAADAYAIFCVGKPEEVIPRDHKLVDYWSFVCEKHEEGQQQFA